MKTLVGTFLLLIISFATLAEEPFTILTYNIWNGFTGAEGSEAKAIKWLQKQDPDVLALQELVGFTQDRLERLAKQWGHDHAVILKKGGYPVGITSKTPIEVVEKKVKGMHHGFLHAKTAGIHFFVIHFSPFRWKVRHKEADTILERAVPLMKAGEKVVVLGDFNAVSPMDKERIESLPKLLARKAASDAEREHVENLKDGKMDYLVLKAMLDAGLIDVCHAKAAGTSLLDGTCPTKVFDNEHILHRIDFILTTEGLAEKCFAVDIPREGVTNEVSDHYPVVARFK